MLCEFQDKPKQFFDHRSAMHKVVYTGSRYLSLLFKEGLIIQNQNMYDLQTWQRLDKGWDISPWAAKYGLLAICSLMPLKTESSEMLYLVACFQIIFQHIYILAHITTTHILVL